MYPKREINWTTVHVDSWPDMSASPLDQEREDDNDAPALYTQFRGGWCDNCRTAFPHIPQDGCCPSCGPVKLRPATITVEPED